MNKERLYSVYCVNDKTLSPAYIGEKELRRINRHRGLDNTPAPIQLRFFLDHLKEGEEIFFHIDDLWLELPLKFNL